VFTIKVANKKLITIVVNVKKKFKLACFHLPYLNFINGMPPSKIQKNEIPSARINALWVDGIVEK
jgi:hypothetical protein